MAKKDGIKKMAAKAGKAGKAGKAVKTKKAKPKAPARRQKKPARTKTETTFRLAAPQAAQVFVAGCFNEWHPTANPLERDDEGTWSCSLYIEPGEHEYRFVVDGVWWDDPVNTIRCWNEFGTQNCVLIVQD
jgi:1,4-alpha-glucan branching enzyme